MDIFWKHTIITMTTIMKIIIIWVVVTLALLPMGK